MPQESIIPDIPGVECTNHDIVHYLTRHVANLCGLNHLKFPGAQPVSFTTRSLEMLEKMDFWVCEKSDGVRVLLFVVMNGMTGAQETWLIDRKQRFFQLDNLHFTHWESVNRPLTDTVLDGELVIDVDPKTGEQVMRYYAFDCLVLDGENIMQKPLVKRFARLREWVIAPMKKAHLHYPDWKANAPFEILAKKQELAYHVSQVLDVHIPQLQHGHDGLIFTCAESAYVPGTDDKILKFKPPSENSVDFKLELRFPPSEMDPDSPDYYAKPYFLLNQWMGGDGEDAKYEYFDELLVTDEEWEEMKLTGEEYDGRIVEVTWDPERQGWRMFRFRDDKPHGNHAKTVRSVLNSIKDGVEIADVLAQQEKVRAAWKAREKRNREAAAAQQQQRRPPQGQPNGKQGGGHSHQGHPGHHGQQGQRPPPPPVKQGLRR